MNTFKVKIDIVCIRVDKTKNKTYLLSAMNDGYSPISILLDKDVIDIGIEKSIVKLLQNLLNTKQEIELIPSIIAINPAGFDDDKYDTIHCVYGVLLYNEYDACPETYWSEYNFLDSSKYSYIVSRTLQEI